MIFKSSQKIYAHIDCDSFFASCEVMRNPKLEHKYVCVGSEIIVAATYNAKSLGIKTGTPIWEAKKILGNKGVFLSPDMRFYGKLSKKLMSFLKSHTLNVEVFSVDEAFVELSGIPQTLGMDITQYSFHLQKKIRQHIGIPVSIGVSNTRIKAKIFSKINKPYGCFIGLDTRREMEAFENLPLRDIPFIGKGYQSRLKYAAETIADYKNLKYSYLKRVIGKNALQLWFELNGVSVMNFQQSEGLKSISRTRSFNKTPSSNKEFVWRQILKNTERLFEELTIRKYEIKNISLQLKNKDWEDFYGSREFTDYSCDRKLVLRELKNIFDELWTPYMLYRKTGVFSSKIRSYTPKQLQLGEGSRNSFEKSVQVEETLLYLGKKYGRGIVKIGI